MSEKILHYFLLGLAICLGAYLLARACLYLREDSSEYAQEVFGSLCQSLEEYALETYVPQHLGWEHSEEVWAKQHVLGNLSALVQYIQKNALPDTVAEDENITREIVKLHNKLLLDEVLQENVGTSGTETEESDNSGTENAENTANGTGASDSGNGTGDSDSGHSDESSAHDSPEVLPAWAQLNNISAPSNISLEKLKDFSYLLQQFFVVDANTKVNSDMFSAEQLAQKDLHIEKKDAPQILIYHTHSQEGYADSIAGDEETSVVGVGNYLEYLMEEVFGYEVIHLKDQFDMVEGYLDRSDAYDYALPAVLKVLQEHPTIEVVIDLHRDGVDENRRLVTEINGKPTAQIMFFNGTSRKASGESRDGLQNPYLTDNLAFSFQLAYEAKTYYSDFIRCVYLKGYRYNLHVRPKSLLLEVGAQTNTVEEAKNAMEPFSVILNKVLNEK